jgi:hypothetical protein
MRSDLHDFQLEIVRETSQAVCVREYAGAPEVWLPKSQIEISRDDPRRGVCTVTMPEWLAIEKELT